MLERISQEMDQGGRCRGSYPPHPEEGAQRSAIGAYKHSVAPVSKHGAAPWFETPRTRLRNLARSQRLLTTRMAIAI